MKQISQMKEIIIVAVAVATLISCQSEKDKLIDDKISSIDARLESIVESIDLTRDEQDRYLELMGKDRDSLTDKELELMLTVEAISNRCTQLNEEREYWILQK